MKKMMNRFKAILEENILLLLLVIGVCGGVFLLAWNSSIRCVRLLYRLLMPHTMNFGGIRRIQVHPGIRSDNSVRRKRRQQWKIISTWIS